MNTLCEQQKTGSVGGKKTPKQIEEKSHFVLIGGMSGIPSGVKEIEDLL